MNILYVGYPLLPVNEESCGGAEQVLSALERAMSARGHQTSLAAADGSRCAGELISTGTPATEPDKLPERERAQWDAVRAALRTHDFDLVHDHSGGFWRHATEVDVPILATLHLPRAMYPLDSFANLPANVFFNCVSQSQAESEGFRDLPGFLGVVGNGIELERFPLSDAREDFVLWLGRVCEEKGPHLAIAAARQAETSIVLAGDVYPFRHHQDFWAREVAPKLEGTTVSFVRQPSFAAKLALLRRAKAVLIPSTVAETSSLVALEAMACGTPVIAFCRGALPGIVEEGRTGFLVESVEEMAAAISRVSEIAPAACRARVAAHFSFSATADAYERLYQDVIARGRANRLAVAS